ncbi:MAG: EAL domain protein [uncultured Sphingomonadaceae bacterium]|uniref:EAL domain protein n=1 Tax=uncultured Sphingomonadaceae bacterium TaxID=169976 RepID=A0A6J4SIC4_9SPHN|nr:MAG: EAL domain protein [uncultured Sphingomonadaceae bacterium]
MKDGRNSGARQGCIGCREGAGWDGAIRMAFHPIVDLWTGEPFAYEALVRGPNGEGAGSVLAQVTDANRYGFDQACRMAAIEEAVAVGLLDTDALLSINFLPNAVYSPVACIQLTLRTAAAVGLPTDRLLFEFTENERMEDTAHVRKIVDTYRRFGFHTAIDDFGAGHAGLGLLADLPTDVVKLDMALVRGVEDSEPRRAIVAAVAGLCKELRIGLIAEGVETTAELRALEALGVRFVQGFVFGRPEVGRLPPPRIIERSAAA